MGDERPFTPRPGEYVVNGPHCTHPSAGGHGHGCLTVMALRGAKSFADLLPFFADPEPVTGRMCAPVAEWERPDV